MSTRAIAEAEQVILDDYKDERIPEDVALKMVERNPGVIEKIPNPSIKVIMKAVSLSKDPKYMKILPLVNVLEEIYSQPEYSEMYVVFGYSELTTKVKFGVSRYTLKELLEGLVWWDDKENPDFQKLVNVLEPVSIMEYSGSNNIGRRISWETYIQGESNLVKVPSFEWLLLGAFSILSKARNIEWVENGPCFEMYVRSNSSCNILCTIYPAGVEELKKYII